MNTYTCPKCKAKLSMSPGGTFFCAPCRAFFPKWKAAEEYIKRPEVQAHVQRVNRGLRPND